MTTVPPPNVALPQVLAAAAAPTTIVIAQPPPALAAIPAGTIIEAIAIPPAPRAPAALAQATAAAVPSPRIPAPASTAPAQAAPTPAQALTAPVQTPAAPATPVVVLHTAVGDLSVRLPAPLPNNVPVELEVVRASPQQVTVRVVTIDGTPAMQYIAQSRTPAAPIATPAPALPLPQTQLPIGPQPLLPGLSWTPSGPAPFVQSGTISAIVTQSPVAIHSAQPPPTAPAPGAPTAQAPAPNPPSLAALTVGTGSELALRIVSVQLPNAPVINAPPLAGLATPAPSAAPLLPVSPSTPAPAAAAPPAQAPSAQAPAAPTPAPTLTPPPPQPGLTLAALPPAPPAPPAAVQPAAPLATASAIVIANADSIPVVEIEGRQVQLNVRANLPVGTKIVFDVAAATPARTGAPLPLPAPPAAMPLSGPAGASVGWPTLSESISLLQRSDPAAAQQLAQAVPDGGPRTAAAVISFVQAMRSGDARQWPGDVTLRALERTSPRGAHLAATLSGEVAELSARSREGGSEWRALPIPWNAGGEIERIALITRREGEGESDEAKAKKGGGERFLIDLNLSRLGPMQLDGMFRKEARSFDMVLRTKAALPETMRRDLGGIFAEANGAMGLKGGLTFQVTKKFADPLGVGNSPDKPGLWA